MATVLDGEYGISNAAVPFDYVRPNDFATTNQRFNMLASRADDCQNSASTFNPLRFYDCLKVNTIGEANDNID